MRTAFRVSALLMLVGFAGNAIAQPRSPGGDAGAYHVDLRSSRWIAVEMERASAALAKAPVAVLVTPFQVDGDSFDATERGLLARTVAAGLREWAGLAVADMTLVERALGASARTIPEPLIVDLAKRIGASIVVVGRVGHDNAGRYEARVESLTLEGGSITSRRTVLAIVDIPFGDTNPPYMSFAAHVEQIVSAVGRTVTPTRSVEGAGAPPVVPATIADLERLAQQGPVQSAYLLQFLGLLHPSLMQSRERNVLFERSLIALERAAVTAETSVLRARAWAHLNRRPLALAVLDSEAAEGVAMRAYLDGDLERLSATVPEIRAPLPRLLATIELARARAMYGRAADTDLIDELATQYPFWAPILAQRLMLIDAWGERSNALAKLALDAYWQMPEFDLDAAMRTAVALRRPLDDYDITKLAFEHIDAIGPLLPGAPDRESPTAADIVRLLQHMLVATVVDRIDHVRLRIAKPDAAMEIALAYEPLLSGQPDYLVARGWAEFGRADELTGPAQSELQGVAYERLRQGALLSQGQTTDAEFVLTFRHQFFPGSEALDPSSAARIFFDSDWPSLPGWGWRTAQTDDDRDHRLRHCVEYSVQDFQCFIELHAFLANASSDAAEQLLAANRHRFIGHPLRIEFLADNERAAGKDSASVALLNEAIAAATPDWEPYSKRGIELAANGKPREALEVFLKYPGFRDGTVIDKVNLSNHAYDAGSMLYWAGAHDEARPLYEFAASLETGSEASITSASRLALLDGDLEAALGYTADRARRYGGQYALRDLMMFLGALGDRQTAWAIFNNMSKELDKPEFWIGALTLQRMEGTELAAVVNWAVQGGRGAARANFESRAMRHVFLLHVTDRKISDELAELIRERDPAPPPLRDRWGIVRFNDAPVWPSHHFGEPPPQQTSLGNQPEERLDGRLTMMASAMAALQRKEYGDAFTIFDRAFRIYDPGEFLPYYAWASAQVASTERVERYIASSLETKERSSRQASRSVGVRFNELLALALLNGFKGDIESALDCLVKTNADILHLEERAVFTRYAIAEAAEMLYEHTSDARYREFLVDLARRNSTIDPAFSWPHAFLAKHSDDASERTSALARALYLDPLSWRAASADAAETAVARRLIARGNPMLNREPDL